MDLQTYGALNGKIENLKKNSLVVPQTAEVGQVLAVKAVDEDGKPTEWETVKAGGFGEVVTEGVVTIKGGYDTEINAYGVAGGMYMIVATTTSVNAQETSVSFARVYYTGNFSYAIKNVFVRENNPSGSSNLGTSCVNLLINSSTGKFRIYNRLSGNDTYKYKIIRLM